MERNIRTRLKLLWLFITTTKYDKDLIARIATFRLIGGAKHGATRGDLAIEIGGLNETGVSYGNQT